MVEHAMLLVLLECGLEFGDLGFRALHPALEVFCVRRAALHLEECLLLSRLRPSVRRLHHRRRSVLSRRALELATKHKTHADTVVYYRNKYLERAGREETDPMFREVAQGLEVDEEAVLLKVERERENEHRTKTTRA